MRIVEPEQIEIKGELNDRIGRSVNNLLSWIGTKTYPSLKQDPGNYRWGADFQGRWIEVMSLLARYMRLPREKLDRIANTFLKGQKASGSFHLRKDIWTLFGDGRGLIGLVEYFRLSGKEKYLDSARKLADSYLFNFKDVFSGTSWDNLILTTALEGFVELWKETKEEKYLNFAEYLIKKIKVQYETAYSRYVHAHSFLTTIYGVLRYYLVTGKEDCLNMVTKTWEEMTHNVMWISGGMPELLPNSIESDEPCTTADWLKINLQLWQITKDAKYLDIAERTLLNHLYFSQLPNGGFSSTANIEQGFRGLEAWWCCSMHAPRALYEVLKSIYTYNDENIWVNFFMSSRAKINLRRRIFVEIEQRTKYPKDGTIKLNLFLEKEVVFNLRIRIPFWTEDSRVKVKLNGRGITAKREKDCFVITRKWQSKDQLEIEFPMLMRVETDILGTHEGEGGKMQVKKKITNAKRIGIFWGPLLLVVFRLSHGNDLTWVYRGGYNEILDSGGMQGSDRSCPDYIQIDDYTFNVDKRDFGVAPSSDMTKIYVKSGHIKLCWEHKLISRYKELGRIEYLVKVFPGLPVKLEYQERLLIKATTKNPKKIKQILLSGVRFSTKQEQYHDTYKQVWKYEYPPAKISVDNKSFLLPKNGQELKNTGKYYLDNGIFTVECRYEGDVKKIITIKREDWTGIYLSPLKKENVTLYADTIFVIKKKLTFPFKGYAESIYMPKEWTDDLMTQPIDTLENE